MQGEEEKVAGGGKDDPKLGATATQAHAAGLHDHASDGIFMTVPNISYKGQISSTKFSKPMPPYFFTNKTVMRMRKIWS